MKKLLLAGAIGLSLVGCATTGTTVPSEPMKDYQRIVEIPNVKQDVIYENSRQWVAKSFKSANSVIQYQDKTAGSIIGKGNVDFSCANFLKCYGRTQPVLEFTFQIDAKDEKARVSFSDINIHHPAGYASGTMAQAITYPATTEQEKTQVKTILDNAINSLSTDIKKTSVNSQW